MKRFAVLRHIGRWLTVASLALLLVCLFCLPALAADTVPIRVAVVLSPDTLTEPGPVEVTIKVTNVSDSTLPGPVNLFYPNNVQIEDYEPVLEAGASKTWEGTWNVTQEQLTNGKLTFKIKYSMYTESGEVLNKTQNFSKEIHFDGQVASVEVNRTITPTTAGKGQEVAVTYDVVNTGNVDITDVTITENSGISSKKGTIASIKAGAKGTYTFTVKMGTKDLTSTATITYKANDKTETVTKEAATIKYGEVKLTGSLSADKKGGLVGETVKLTLALRNTGKEDVEHISVTDPVYGDVFTEQTVRAGETLSLEWNMPISATTDYQMLISGTDTAGNDIETASSRVTVTAVDPSQVITLQVDASVDKDIVYQLPDTVYFTVGVTNTSAVNLKNVSVLAGENTLYTFPEIAAGETRSFTRDAQINMGGQFQFRAQVRNQLNDLQTFPSNILYISYTAPTAVPTDAPLVTPPAPVYEQIPTPEDMPAWYDMAGRGLNLAAIILGALTLVGAVLLVIGGVNRAIARRDRVEPMDTLENPIQLLQNMPATEHTAEEETEQKDFGPIVSSEDVLREVEEAVASNRRRRPGATGENPVVQDSTENDRA